MLDSGLYAGQELSSDELKRYKHDSDYGKLYERTLRWIAIRPRSEWEIDIYIAKICKVGPCKTCQKLKKRLIELGLVDDEKFAASWVASRRAIKPISRRKLHLELRQKRVPTEIIEKTLAEDETDELEVLKTLIERKTRQSQYHDRQKIIAYLARQGFRYDDIKTALEESEL